MTVQNSALAGIRVADAMHRGIFTADPSTSMREVARLMTHERIHVVAITDPDHALRPLGIVSVLDIANAAAHGLDGTAGESASSELTTVTNNDALSHAAHLMVEHATDHLLVVDDTNGHALGVISGLDIAAAYADAGA